VSLLSPSRLCVGLAPDAVEFTLTGRSALPKLETVMVAAAGPERWRGALLALGGILRQISAQKLRTSCSVVLSGHFVRTELLPWNEHIRGIREYRALARARFRAIHGAAAEAWDIRLGILRYGEPVLACAVDSALLTELDALVSECGLRLTSVQPHFAEAFDRHRRLCSGASWWFALIEPGRLWMGQSVKGAWRHVGTRVLGADPVAEILDAMVQESALTAAESPLPMPVHVVVTGMERDQIRVLRESGIRVIAAVAARRFELGVAA